MARFAYLDESGDTGFKFRQGSTDHFVIAIVLVDDPLPLQVAIDDLRDELRLPRRVEFKFNKRHRIDRITSWDESLPSEAR